MKKLFLTLIALSAPLCAAEQAKIGVVNFKMCVEQSQAGKKEQVQFESMKKQMEQVLEEKDKELNAIASKFNDADYMDSLSAEAEAELKHKFRNSNQEMSAMQNQYYQALNQANYKVMQGLHDLAAKAASTVAQKKGLTIVLGEESAFFVDNSLDISKDVIAQMDETFAKEPKQ